MRLDKFLKCSKLLKRRTVAKDVTAAGRAHIGERVLKPGYEVKVGDCITVRFGAKDITFRVLSTALPTQKNPVEMAEIISEEK